jgi:hypothetical protein
MTQPVIALLARLRRPPQSASLGAQYDFRQPDYPRHSVRLYYSFEGTLKTVAAEIEQIATDLHLAGLAVVEFDGWKWQPLDRPPRLRTKCRAHGYVRVEPTLDAQENEAVWKRALAEMRERLDASGEGKGVR